MSVFSDYKKTIMDAAHNERIRLALSRAIASYRSNRNTAMEKFPHTIKMAEEEGVFVTRSQWYEKINDIICYLLLLKALLKERENNETNKV